MSPSANNNNLHCSESNMRIQSSELKVGDYVMDGTPDGDTHPMKITSIDASNPNSLQFGGLDLITGQQHTHTCGPLVKFYKLPDNYKTYLLSDITRDGNMELFDQETNNMKELKLPLDTDLSTKITSSFQQGTDVYITTCTCGEREYEIVTSVRLN